MSDPIYYIYKITNTINEKAYIGFTDNPNTRIAQHKHTASPKYKGKRYLLANAIKRYGWKSFLFEILYCSKERHDTLNVMEHTFIKRNNTFYKYGRGYNMTLGGPAHMGIVIAKPPRN
jgi:group I intron endonuclease